MTSISQKIPNLFGGISQQPDTKKVPGQVRKLVNGYPEFALGLLKRPGAKYEQDLIEPVVSSNTPQGTWFEILRDSSEKYICQFTTETLNSVTVPNVKIWRMSDGLEMFVDRSLLLTEAQYSGANIQGSLGNSSPPANSLQDVIDKWNAYYTAVLDADTATSLVSEISDYQTSLQTYAQTSNTAQDTQESKFETTSTFDYGNVHSWLKWGVAVNQSDSTKYWFNDGTVTTSAPSGFTQGNERTADVPQLASIGYKFYEAVVTTAGSGSASTPATFANKFKGPRVERGTASTEYKDFIDTLATYNSTTIGTSFAANYLGVSDTTNLEFLTDNDVTYILNKEKAVAYTSTQSDSGLQDAWLVEVRVFETSKPYTITVYYQDVGGGNAGQHPAAGTTYSSTTGLDDFYTKVTENANDGHGTQSSNYTVTRNNNAFLFRPASGKEITDVEVQGEGLDYIISINNEVSDVSRLPQSAFHGKKIKVVNINDIDIDDMFVEYRVSDSSSAGDAGEGSWVETVAPSINFQLDHKTLPHQLVRNGTYGHFELKPLIKTSDGSSLWEDRRVGDETTNPDPAFIGKNINGMFFYRNRFCFLTGSNVMMSRANKLYDFFNKSALAVGDDDPVNVAAVSSRPVDLSYVSQTSVGMLLFGTQEQFLLTTNNDILSPKTASINTISKFAIDTKLEAESMGTSTVFFSKTKNFLSSFELLGVSNQTAPNTIEHTQIVPELLPATIDKVATSPPKSILCFGETGTETLYQYRFLRIGERELATAWYQWSLPGKLVHLFFDDRDLFAVVHDSNGRCFLVSYNLNQASKTGYLQVDDFSFDPCLDMWALNPVTSYDSGADTTSFFLPYPDTFSKSTYAVLLDTSDQQKLNGESAFFYADATEAAAVSIRSLGTVSTDADTGNAVWTVDGDLRGRDVIFGYKYTMEVELPTIFLQSGDADNPQTDSDSDLILKQLKVLTGPSGPVSYKIDIKGISPSTYTKVNTDIGDYTYNALNVSLGDTKTVPVFQRNKNVTITAIGDSPLPVNLLSITWEGRATSKFYKRV